MCIRYFPASAIRVVRVMCTPDPRVNTLEERALQREHCGCDLYGGIPHLGHSTNRYTLHPEGTAIASVVANGLGND
jgi:hypothetical protein